VTSTAMVEKKCTFLAQIVHIKEDPHTCTVINCSNGEMVDMMIYF
jgi:hypothetical protein